MKDERKTSDAAELIFGLLLGIIIAGATWMISIVLGHPLF